MFPPIRVTNPDHTLVYTLVCDSLRLNLIVIRLVQEKILLSGAEYTGLSRTIPPYDGYFRHLVKRFMSEGTLSIYLA